MPSELKGVPSGNYIHLQRKIETATKDFIDSLSDEQKTMYENLCELMNESHFQEEVSTFVFGFRLGSKFIINAIK